MRYWLSSEVLLEGFHHRNHLDHCKLLLVLLCPVRHLAKRPLILFRFHLFDQPSERESNEYVSVQRSESICTIMIFNAEKHSGCDKISVSAIY